jgi:hypothetical protein
MRPSPVLARRLPPSRSLQRRSSGCGAGLRLNMMNDGSNAAPFQSSQCPVLPVRQPLNGRVTPEVSPPARHCHHSPSASSPHKEAAPGSADGPTTLPSEWAIPGQSVGCRCASHVEKRIEIHEIRNRRVRFGELDLRLEVAPQRLAKTFEHLHPLQKFAAPKGLVPTSTFLIRNTRPRCAFAGSIHNPSCYL